MTACSPSATRWRRSIAAGAGATASSSGTRRRTRGCSVRRRRKARGKAWSGSAIGATANANEELRRVPAGDRPRAAGLRARRSRRALPGGGAGHAATIRRALSRLAAERRARRRSSRAIWRPCTCRAASTSTRCRASRPSACSRRWPAASRWSARPGRTARACSARPGLSRGADGDGDARASCGAGRDDAGLRAALAAQRAGDHPRAPHLRASGGRTAGDRRRLLARASDGGRLMRIAFYGSSLLSSYWNGAATYYRGLLARARAARPSHHLLRAGRLRPAAASRHRAARLGAGRRLSGDRRRAPRRDRRGARAPTWS